MGALLRVQIMLTDDVIKTIHDLQALGMKVYASTPSAEALSITKADFSSGAVCVGTRRTAFQKRSSRAVMRELQLK